MDEKTAVAFESTETVLDAMQGTSRDDPVEIAVGAATAQTLAVLTLVRLLDEIAGPHCGHGLRRITCPYLHREGE